MALGTDANVSFIQLILRAITTAIAMAPMTR